MLNCAKQNRIILNLLRSVRRWRILNCIVISLCCIFLIKTVNNVPEKIVTQPEVINSNLKLDKEEEVKVKEEIKSKSESYKDEIEQTLLVEVQDFLIRRKDSIPKVIHQIYRNASIPLLYKDLIKSWIEHNPEYEYWFWDDESGRMFIEMYYPEFLPLYDSYCHDLFRSDALRYFILNELGGVYVDMDYVCLKSIDRLVEDRNFYIVQEHGPQAQLLYDTDDMILNAWMAVVPYHPFMNFLINNLASHANCKFQEVLKSTGPLFVYKMMKKYYNVTKCNNDICDLKVLPYTLMMPEWDTAPDSQRHKMKACRKMIELTARQRKACLYFRKNQFQLPETLPSEAFATHKFLHLGNKAKNYKDRKGYVHIKEIVPKVTFPMEKIMKQFKKKVEKEKAKNP